MTRGASTVDRPARVAVIGAGMAGLTAARTLARAGFDVLVIDKGRGPGGRMASKRLASSTADHGAQYFTARDSRFQQEVSDWVDAGVVDQWRGRLGVVSAGSPVPLADDSVKRYVGVPRMSALTRHMSGGLEVRTGCRIERIRRMPAEGWILDDDSGATIGTFDFVLVTVPPEQAVELLHSAPVLAAQASNVQMLPCWSVILRFDSSLPVSFDGIFASRGVDDHERGRESASAGPLSWAARNSSKPGRSNEEVWIVHATSSWSRANLEADRVEVQERLGAALFELLGQNYRAPVESIAHRWRYARCETPLPDKCLWEPDLGIGVAGDWCHGANVEAAYLSGLAIAESVMRSERGVRAAQATQSGR